MKLLILFSISILSLSLTAQSPTGLDTLYANSKKNVALFFPSTIRQAITGSPNFTFVFNENTAQHFGLLKAVPGPESNLLAITSDGQVYSYILKYKEDIPVLNHFIPISESIGNEIPIIVERIKLKPVVALDDSTSDILSPSLLSERELYYQKYSEYLLITSHETLSRSRKDGLVLKIKNIAYNRSETYIVLEVKNRSGSDFEIDQVGIFKVNGTKRRKSSYQELPLEPIDVHGLPEVVRDGDVERFVCVLEKITLGRNENLQIEIKERNGGRFLKLTD